MFKKIVPFIFYPLIILVFLFAMTNLKHSEALSHSEKAEIDRYLMVEKRLKQNDDKRQMETKQHTKSAFNSKNHLPTVSMNDENKYVRYLQSLLNISEDGVYGQETYEKVVEFQLANDLSPNGVVDQKTWNKLLRK